MSDVPMANLRPHWFNSISEIARASLLNSARKRVFRNREFVMMQGDVNRSIFLVESGALESSRLNSDGEEVKFRLVQPGNSVGEVEFASGRRTPITVKSVGKSHVLEFAHADVLSVGMKHPEVLLGVSNSMSALLSTAIEMIDSLMLSSIGERIVWRLRWISNYGEPAGDGWVRIEVSQTDFADMIGMSRQTTNRELKALQERGIIKIEYRSLIINLAAIAETEE